MAEERSIVEHIKDQLSSGITSVPVFHAVALKLQQVLGRPNFRLEEVNRLISADPGLVSQVLRVANSSYYAGLSKVGTMHEAIVRLGSREVASIAMLATQQDQYRSDDPRFNAMMQILWKHAFCCAVGSKWLAQRTGYDMLVQEAFLAGLLHDIGNLFLLKLMEQIGKAQQLPGGLNQSIISEVLASMHVEQGYQLLMAWHLPEAYCTVVAGHEAEQWDQGNPLLAMVRLADQSCKKLGIGMHRDPSLHLFGSAEAQVLGLKEIALAELEIVLEDALKNPV
ncbi:HD family phosphohydrolase [Geomonas limicola]|uniref:HD family phosphohydrolase n=1 Tax=Geomonas limicola TaxID=2740186 RepID=A0A6V8N6M8_9BACT|nr:HDOD domain-containing protein [Geomonas limicola]GFO67584.1 HD family phosphohydrolase [Geomonas limicola]